MALVRLGQSKCRVASPPYAFRTFAAAVWALTMWLFYLDKDLLQPGLKASMEYIYLDSERWKSLRTLVWHNK